MRVRTLAAAVIVLGLLPAVSGAQIRRPGIGGRRTPPAEMPRQPGEIRRELAYRRSHVTYESYPMLAIVSAPGYVSSGQASSWTAFGGGSRLAYRFTQLWSGTLDVTSAAFGGLANTETIELGSRFGPQSWDSKIRPYVDVRAGYIRMFDSYTNGGESVFVPTSSGALTAQWSEGYGIVGGFGLDRSISRSWAITVGTSWITGKLENRRAGSTAPADKRYAMTAQRVTFGIKFNPVSMITESRGAR